MRKVPDAKQEAALKVALEAVSGINLREIFGIVTDTAEDCQSEIIRACNPQWEKQEQEHRAIHHRIYTLLKEKGLQHLAENFDNALYERLWAAETSGFYLGFAAALRFLGSISQLRRVELTAVAGGKEKIRGEYRL